MGIQAGQVLTCGGGISSWAGEETMYRDVSLSKEGYDEHTKALGESGDSLSSLR